MDPTAHNRPRYSIVVPVFNEQAVLPVLLHRLDLMMQDIDGVAETIFVDDGSSDCSAIILRAKAKDDPRYDKYPRVPVGRCPGYEGRSSTR